MVELKEAKLEDVLKSCDKILDRLLRRGLLESAVGNEDREFTMLESMETLVRIISGQAVTKKEHAGKLEQINIEITQALKSFHDHDVPETLNHLLQAKVLLLELHKKLLEPAQQT